MHSQYPFRGEKHGIAVVRTPEGRVSYSKVRAMTPWHAGETNDWDLAVANMFVPDGCMK